MQVGTSKDQGLYNKPSAAVHPWALAAGTLPQYSNNNSLGYDAVNFSINVAAASTFNILAYFMYQKA